jgi:hypothetical protein
MVMEGLAVAKSNSAANEDIQFFGVKGFNPSRTL